MRSKLKERFARLGQVRGVGRVPSGSPVDLVLRPAVDPAAQNSIAAVMALARRGMTMLRAKRAIEAVLEQGEAIVEVPTVENPSALASELRAAGFKTAKLARDPIDVRAVREMLGMTQDQFARRFNLSIDAVQNWEHGRTNPDRAAMNYLRVIARQPEAAARAQEEDAA
jgi:DNA-binding transcriptional regulator YiaG